MRFILIHSPFAGPLTWIPTARALEEQGHTARVPSFDITRAPAPLWPYLAGRVAAVVADPPSNEPLVLVAHSAAGLLVPAARAALPNRVVRAYIFADAALPRDGTTLGELTPAGAGVTLEMIRAQAHGGVLPPLGSDWPKEFWDTLLPDPHLRARFVAELPPVPLALYEEPTPSVPDWPDAPCCYLRFSALYEATKEDARRSGWRTRGLGGQHLHMLVDPSGTAGALTELATSPGT